ncbi:MAG: putative peptide zinc metalloprotease protein [Oleispira sp.]
MRLPLLDPEKLLAKTAHFVTPLFNRWIAMLWVIVLSTALLLATMHWSVLTSNISDRVLALENLFLMLLIYPVVKIVHEMGHAFAVKKWGGEVHEVGVVFLVFFPVPYVDASAATAFRNKYQRMLVGAIGILVEIFIAATAMIVWVFVEPGLVRALAFNTMVISGVSTVLFNGNPLLRFDAYYVLADWLEIPNLANRSNTYVGYWVKAHLMGVRGGHSPASSRREASWLMGYAVSSYLYRIVIMMTIALFIITKYLFVGAILAMWTLWIGFLLPFAKLVVKPFTDRQLQQQRRHTWSVVIGGISLLVLVLAVIPFPYATYVQGVLTATEKSQVRVGASGFVDVVLVDNDNWVDAGQDIIRLSDPDLDAEKRVLQAQVVEAEASYRASLKNRVDAGINRELLDLRRSEYQRVLDKVSALIVSAPQSGTFILPSSFKLNGRYLSRGELVGNVIDFGQLPVTVMVAEDDINVVRESAQSVEVRFSSHSQTVYPGSVSRIVPASSKELVNEVLAVKAGGLIVTDPEPSKGKSQAFKRYFRLEIDVPDAPRERLNERVHVLFNHDPEPLLWRWLRDARRVLLRQLNV